MGNRLTTIKYKDIQSIKSSYGNNILDEHSSMASEDEIAKYFTGNDHLCMF